MSEATQLKPYDWLKSIPSALLKLDGIPLLASHAEFPWEKFSKELAKNLQVQSLKITPHEPQWRSAEELTQDFGDHAFPLNITVPSFEGALTWIMAEKDIRHLMSALLNQGNDDLAFIHPDYVEGFYRFAAQEVLFVLSQLKFMPAISPQINDERIVPKEPCLCLDIQIDVQNQPLKGRLLISPEMRHSWIQAQSGRSLEIPDHFSEKIFIQLAIEAGRTTLSLNEWKHVAPGDFVILDSCSLVPGDEKGRVMLTLNETPFFRAKIKQGSLKLLEHPLHYEVNQNMGKKISEDEDEFEHEDSELDDDFFDDESEEFEHHDEETEESDVDESLHDEDEEYEEEEEVEQPEKKGKDAEHHPEKASAASMNFEEIPLSIVVEVGRLQMSIKKLTELQPGNLLELDIRPEDGVDLVVSGKRIAKGELLRIGDVLGVRILDIG